MRIDTWASAWNGRYGGPKAKRDILALLKRSPASVRVHQAGFGNSFGPSTQRDVAVFQYPTRGMTPPERYSQLESFAEAWQTGWRSRILFIHDIKSVQHSLFRTLPDATSAQDWRLCEQRIFQAATHIIVHSEAMAAEAQRLFALHSQQLITLGLFDYICEPLPETHVPVPEGRLIVAFCGNLHASGLADELNTNLPMAPWLRYAFYGSRVPSTLWLRADVEWIGDFEPDALPHQLRASGAAFGLCWWSSEVMSSTYLTLTAPHKASCYIAAGLPILVPAATHLADIVTAHGVGLCLRELRDIAPAIGETSDARQRALAVNASRLGRKIRGGHFTRAALAAALGTIPNRPGVTTA